MTKRLRRLPWATIRACLTIAASIGAVLLLVFATSFHIYLFWGVFPGLLGSMWYRARYRGGSEAIRELMEFPPVAPQYPLEVAYLRDGAKYGSDVGVASFEGGYLHFQGRRSWFDLVYADAFISVRDMASNKRLRGFRRYHIKAREAFRQGGAPSWELQLVPLDEIKQGESGYRARFNTAINGWIKHDESRRWTSFLPPATARPEAVVAAEWGFFARKILLVLLIVGWFGALAAHQYWAENSSLCVLVLAVLLVPIYYLGLNLRWAARHVCVLRSLRQQQD